MFGLAGTWPGSASRQRMRGLIIAAVVVSLGVAGALRLPVAGLHGRGGGTVMLGRADAAAPARGTPALFALPSGFTLDRSAIPRGILAFKESNNLVLALVSVLVLSRLVPRKLQFKVPLPSFSREALEQLLWPAWLQNAVEAVKSPIVRLAVFIKLCIKVLLAKTFMLVGSILGAVSRTLDLNPAEEVDIKDWSVCVLDERESLSGGIIKYRFGLPNPSATVPLYVGQEVSAAVAREFSHLDFPWLTPPHPTPPLPSPLAGDNVPGGCEGQGTERTLLSRVLRQLEGLFRHSGAAWGQRRVQFCEVARDSCAW